MAFDSERVKFTKEHFWIVQFTIDAQTFTFCENRSPIPVGLSAIPTIQKCTVSPCQIDVKGGLGVRASATISFDHHMDYSIFGSIDSPVRFWPLFRATYPYYQNIEISIFDGYIVDDTYHAENFQEHKYIINQFAINQSGSTIIAKDPLKLADNSRQKIPAASSGKLAGDILSTDTTAALSPTGIGDLEYPASGWVRIGKEVIAFTRSGDTLTLTRAQYTTLAEDHSLDDVVQLCYQNTDQAQNIAYDILVNYAGVDSGYINKTQWDSEADLYLSGLLDGIITKPEGVNKILQELCEQAPHYLFWNDRTNTVEFVAIKEPPALSRQLTDEGNFIEQSFSAVDQPDSRVSRIYVNFGQSDPTKNLDEYSNYSQTHVRVDVDSEANYGSPATKIINSRWINNSNKSAALLLAARIGRRFSDAPRVFNFKLDHKDGDVWTGDPVVINSADVLNDSGDRVDVPAQILTSQISTHYSYSAIEHTWGAEMPEDGSVGDPDARIVIIAGNRENIILRDIYDSLYPTPTADLKITFIFESSSVSGSSNVSLKSVRTGAWTEVTQPPTLDVRGYIVGKGGDGLDPPEDGGIALSLDNDIWLNNTGTVGGGGGAGGVVFYSDGTTRAKGSGGAGYYVGRGVASTASDGTLTSGGPEALYTRAGGDLGQAGSTGTLTSGGAAGKAIELNGYTVTYINTGTILGAVS